MSDQSSTSQEQLEAYLRHQIEVNNRKAKTTWFIGLVVIFVLFAYLANLYQTADELYLNPETLASIMVNKADKSASSFIAELEGELIANAPATATEFSRQVMNMMPAMRKEAQHLVSSTHQDLLPAHQESLAVGLKSYIQANQSELKNPSVDQLAEALSAEADRLLIEKLDEAREAKPVIPGLTVSPAVLMDEINTQLDGLL